jgi:hypothetical protein
VIAHPLKAHKVSFPTRASRAIGNPESLQKSRTLLWILDQAFGLSGMTTKANGPAEYIKPPLVD